MGVLMLPESLGTVLLVLAVPISIRSMKPGIGVTNTRSGLFSGIAVIVGNLILLPTFFEEFSDGLGLTAGTVAFMFLCSAAILLQAFVLLERSRASWIVGRAAPDPTPPVDAASGD